jgi:hypothetical protein
MIPTNKTPSVASMATTSNNGRMADTPHHIAIGSRGS